MKIVYCMADLYNPGGMERVLVNKLRHLSGKGGYELAVVTTDQHGRPPFYDIPGEVKMTDLGINYKDDTGKNPFAKTVGYLSRRCAHRKALTEYLMRERPDIVVSLYPSESSFIPDIKDGSKKVLELHFNRYFRIQYGRKGLLGLADRLRSRRDPGLARRFDAFVVLTRQDARLWGDTGKLRVIPNAAPKVGMPAPWRLHKRVIAVGRLDYQKGFDMLLDAWALLPESLRNEWELDIFGQGEWKDMLHQRIEKLGIAGSARINAPSSEIFREYAKSDFLVMSSRYEGFPMVMVEAMACGLPAVSFDFLCGPRDIIKNGVNGLVVPGGDINALASAMEQLMEAPEKIAAMSACAVEVSEIYSEERVMEMWSELFSQLMK